MKLSELYWHRITPLHLLLWPLSIVYGGYLTLKKLCYWLDIVPSVKLPVPVIVIDSISVDDGGKTPFLISLVNCLLKNGYRPGIITRGNYDNPGSPVAVTPATSSNTVGGKILLLAQHCRETCPVWVGSDRVAVAKALLDSNPSCNIILCNDGMQFYRLERNLEIAVADFSGQSFGNALLLPAGPLRIPARHLEKIDFIVTNGKQSNYIDTSKWVKTYKILLVNETAYNVLNPEIRCPITDFKNKRLHIITDEENARWFFDVIQKSGLTAQLRTFPDNHQFIESDIQAADAEVILMPEEHALQCRHFAKDTLWALSKEAWISDELQAIILKKLSKTLT